VDIANGSFSPAQNNQKIFSGRAFPHSAVNLAPQVAQFFMQAQPPVLDVPLTSLAVIGIAATILSNFPLNFPLNFEVQWKVQWDSVGMLT
jgi:hypothetical protein